LVRVVVVPAERVLALRQQVLRPGLGIEHARFDDDDHPQTVHLAAVDEAGTVVGCSTWFPDPWQGQPAWRLRGMATATAARGTGLGGRLLAAGLEAARERGATIAWCNARTTALGFYRRYGFETVGAQFTSAHGIAHYAMVRRLDAEPTVGPAPGADVG
jgi:predicted GNAT family N-acyltransferase